MNGDKKLRAEKTDPIYMHESAKVNYPFEGLKDGDVIPIGNPENKGAPYTWTYSRKYIAGCCRVS